MPYTSGVPLFGRRREPVALTWPVAACGADGHTLVTRRLVLRPLTPADAPAVRGTVDDEVLRWNGIRSGEVDDLLLERPSDTPLLEEFAICDRRTGAIIGGRILRRMLGAPHAVLLGSWLGPGWRRQGLGTEELYAILDYAHTHLGYEVVAAGTHWSNLAARRQHENVGMTVYNAEDVRMPTGVVMPGVWYCHQSALSVRRCTS